MRRGDGCDVFSLLSLFQLFIEKYSNVILHLHDILFKMELKSRIKSSVQGKYDIAVYQ
jgi:hypothetical protein